MFVGLALLELNSTAISVEHVANLNNEMADSTSNFFCKCHNYNDRSIRKTAICSALSNTDFT